MLLNHAKDVLQSEIAALEQMKDRLGPNFVAAARLVLDNPTARIVASGIGKAGIIAQKAVATLASTGTIAFYLHPSDALHGDLGMAAPGDIALLFSNSGESEEVIKLIPFLRRRGLKLVAVTSSARSTLGVRSDAVLEIGSITEACPLGLAPTSSTTAMLALADAFAIALMRERGFTSVQYNQLHPAGELGRKSMPVSDVMRAMSAVACATHETTLRDALRVMTEARAGATLVVDTDRRLVGIFTDGDLRRNLLELDDLLDRTMGTLVNKSPLSIRQTQTVRDAIALFREHRIGELPVVDDDGCVVGLVDLKNL